MGIEVAFSTSWQADVTFQGWGLREEVLHFRKNHRFVNVLAVFIDFSKMLCARSSDFLKKEASILKFPTPARNLLPSRFWHF